MSTSILTLVITLALSLILLVLGVIFITYIGLFAKSYLSGATIGFPTLVAMRLRGVPASLIVDSRIAAVKAGLILSSDELEAHYLAEGNVIQTVQALVAADKANINLDWQRACAIDLATKGTGKSVLEAVHTSINPKVIECPDSQGGRSTIDGVAKDGIQVKARARVTVRSNLENYVGSALEETVIARVGEGIVTTIGSADTYKTVLESPDTISKVVLDRGLDVGTAFEILSIDIADVDVGENIGAKLQESQAEADKNVAQAKAEMRRAAAVAAEQENKAKVEEMKARVVEAEAQVPLAPRRSFSNWQSWRDGLLSIKPISRPDTDMRDSISKGEEKS